MGNFFTVVLLSKMGWVTPFFTRFAIIKTGTRKQIKKRIDSQRGTEFVNIFIADSVFSWTMKQNSAFNNGLLLSFDKKLFWA